MITKILKFIAVFTVLFIITSSYTLSQIDLSQEFQDDTGGSSTVLEPVHFDGNKNSDFINEKLEEENNLAGEANAIDQSARETSDNMQQFSQTEGVYVTNMNAFKFLSIASFILSAIALVCCGYGFFRSKSQS